ncbi:ABCC11 [Symbiodinium microadriaticum]|nr:ABCC11 [Symbiodinium microadriaticum]
MVRCCRLVGASLLLVFCTSANGSCDMDAARRNSTACHNVFADENSFVQSWKRADRVPADQHPWLPTSGLQLKTMWWAPIMWLVVLVPLAVMLCMATKPEKGATEALLHSQNQEFRDHEMEAGNSCKDIHLDVAGLRDIWLCEVQRQGPKANLLKVLLQHCISESWMANAYGTFLGALAFLCSLSLSIALGQLLAGVRRASPSSDSFDGWMIVLACAVLPCVVGCLEAESCTRNARFSARSSAALMGLLGAKAQQLPATKAGMDPLASLGGIEGAMRISDQIGEAVPCLWRAAMACAQATILLAWLWMRFGALVCLAPLGFVPLLVVTACRLHGLVEAYVSYETAAQLRQDFVSDAQSKHGLPQVPTQNFLERAQGLRREELDFLWMMHNVSYQVSLLAARWPQLVALACIVTISILAPQQPEVLLPLFLQVHCLLRQLSVCSSSVTKLGTAKPALARVEAFLHRPELEKAILQDPGLCLHLTGSFAWEDSEIESLPVLVDLDLKVPCAALLAVLGTSGAGKTSLLYAAAGALRPLADACMRRTPSALLLPSKPWIFPGSLQDNILCGRCLDLDRYQTVVKATGLEHADNDPASWDTAKVALARAAYGREELVLMDDPFNGMAAADAKRIIREVLQGPLFAGRCCIVAFSSNTAQLSEGFSGIILEGGAVAAAGRASDLSKAACGACGWGAPEGRPRPRPSHAPAPSCGARRKSPLLGAGQKLELEAKEREGLEGQGQGAEKGAAGGVFGALAFLRLAGRGRVACVYLLLLVDQILQTGLDWVLLVAALQVRQSRSLFSFNWHFATCWVNLMLKVVLARAAASCCAAAGETFHRQWLLRVTKATNASASQVVARDMKVVDIGLSHQVWVLFAMLCSTLGLLCLVHVRLPQPLFGLLLALPAYATACWCLLKSFRQRVDFHRKQCACKSSVCKLLHDCFAPGMAARLMAKEPYVLEVEEKALQAYARQHAATAAPSAALMVQLSLCLSAVYTVAAVLTMSNSDDVMEVGLTLAPLALLVHFLLPCIDALNGFEDVGAAAGGLVHELEERRATFTT